LLKYSTFNVQKPWLKFLEDVNNKRYEWDELGVVRRIERKWSKGEGFTEFEDITIDIHCPEKKEYLDFWSWYFKIPKYDIRSGLIGEEWASLIAQSEPVLFSKFLSERQLNQTFAEWIDIDDVRVATKQLYKDNTSTSWSELVRFITIVSRRTATISSRNLRRVGAIGSGTYAYRTY
jgi:hypothetical protein